MLTTDEIKIVQQDQDIDVLEKEALGRFQFLCTSRLNRNKGNPFIDGFWQANFVLLSKPDAVGLKMFLDKLRASETGRTGWDIGWVPTRSGITPYPYQGGIEVWLAEDGDKGPGHSDFWRAEPSGRFALFRGYQEDDTDFRQRHDLKKDKVVDFSLVLWRVSEFLLYLENFAKQMRVNDSKAVIKIKWGGLNKRIISNYKGFDKILEDRICLQNEVASIYEINRCTDIKKNLLRDVHKITMPLFESFSFFSLTEEIIKNYIKELFDPDKECL